VSLSATRSRDVLEQYSRRLLDVKLKVPVLRRMVRLTLFIILLAGLITMDRSTGVWWSAVPFLHLILCDRSLSRIHIPTAGVSIFEISTRILSAPLLWSRSCSCGRRVSAAPISPTARLQHVPPGTFLDYHLIYSITIYLSTCQVLQDLSWICANSWGTVFSSGSWTGRETSILETSIGSRSS
jgi:hypothetical protein